MSQKPNLFKYATSELSQDAVICYMLEWAKPEFKSIDYICHSIGIRLLNAFFGKYENKQKPDFYNTIKIYRQVHRIDILCIINNTFYIIIEDKTNTSHHNGQLKKYFEAVNKKRQISEENILRIYYKSGEEYDKEALHEYKLFSKIDILEVLKEETQNQIIIDYKEYISKLNNTSNYKNLPFDQWRINTWIAFVSDLKNKSSEISTNLSSLVELGNQITHGKGGNKGVYFNRKIISKDNIIFYLRISFEKKRIEFKLEQIDGGAIINKEIMNKYYNFINKKISMEIKKSRTPNSKNTPKTKTIATINQPVIHTYADKLIDMEKTVTFFERIINIHNEIVENLNSI